MTAPLTHSIQSAAAKLGGPFTVDFLRGHIDEIPHIRVGKGSGRAGRIAFTDAHLERIVAMFSIEPENPEPTTPDQFSSMVTRRGRRSA